MRRILLVVALTIGVLAPAYRAASSPPVGPTITLRGNETSFVDVRFNERFQLDDRGTTMDFKGKHAGWLIHPVARADFSKGDFAGAYSMTDVGPNDPEYGPHVFTVTASPRTFRPGVYRVYLIADGPTAIHIPMLKGSMSKTIRPVRRTAAFSTATDLEFAGPGVVNDNAAQKIRVVRDSLTFSSLYLYSNEGATVQSVEACLKDGPEEATYPDQNCEGGGFIGQVLHPTQDYIFTLNSIYPPGSLKTGKYYSWAKARATKVDRAMGVAFTIGLP